MANLIAIIILTGSLLGMSVILFKKIPILAGLPEISPETREPIVLKIKDAIKNLPGIRNFSYTILLQKILSKIRILTLKTENQTGNWLEKLRRKSNQKNNFSNEEYWEELKKAKNGK